MIIDSHCHLHLIVEQAPEYTLEALLDEAKKASVIHILNVATRLLDHTLLCEIAALRPGISISAGSHPNESEAQTLSFDALLNCAKHSAVVALGETGLDYYRTKEKASQNRQRDAFLAHVACAKAVNKPLIVHSRAASADTLQVLEEAYRLGVSGVWHCFTEDAETALRAIDFGFYVGISGVLTFKNAEVTREVAKKAPVDRLLLETDAPYLAPVPHRGKLNHSGLLPHTALCLAECCGLDVPSLLAVLKDNYFSLFQGSVARGLL